MSGRRRRAARVACLGAGIALFATFGCERNGTTDRAPGTGVTPSTSPGASDAAPSGDAWFEDVAAASGIAFRHVSGHRDRHYFPEIMGGGGALFDMDGDGDLDVYLVQSGTLYHERDESARNRLFSNRGDGTFIDVTDASGADDRGYGMGVAVGDYDEDGDEDLYVANFGANALLRNDGGGHFADVTEASGAGDPAWGVSTTFSDFDADGDLDLFVVNYVNWSMETELECASTLGEPDYCLPTNYEAPARDTLLRNDGNGRFSDVSDDVGLRGAFGYGLGVVSVDFDGDGSLDVFVANDTVFNQLWLNHGDGTFYDDALLRGCAVDEDGMTKAGMGVAAIDYDDDADPDLLVVNLEREADSYYENDGGFFFDRTVSVGLGAASQKYTRFGVGFVDFDNDGYLDLYQANGRVVRASSPPSDDPYAEENVLYRGGADRKLHPVQPTGGTTKNEYYTSRAAAFGDVDGDGGLDILVVNRDGPAQLFHNVRVSRGNWIALEVRERAGRMALGATVTITVGDRTITRDVLSGSSYAAANDPVVHVGLGPRESVDDVRVRWVDGATDSFGSLDANRTHELRRGAPR